MSRQNEFTKWIKLIESASMGTHSGVGNDNDPVEGNCGCGEWDCPDCYPEQPATRSKEVKLGELVQTTSFRKAGTASADTADRTEDDDNNLDTTMYEDDFSSSSDTESTNQFSALDDSDELISAILYMQDMGLSKSSVVYDVNDLHSLSPTELKSVHDEIMTGSTASDDVSDEQPDIAKPAAGVKPQSAPNSTAGTKPPTTLANDGDKTPVKESLRMPTLLEQIGWDVALEEELIDESSLSKLIGKQAGGQALVRWLHRMHRLSNDAELTPASFKERLFWKQFKSHPDDFIIVSASGGVAGIKPSKEYIDFMVAKAARVNKSYNPGTDPHLRYQIVAFTRDGEKVNTSLLQQVDDSDKKGDKQDSFSTVDPTVIKARMGLIHGKDTQNPDNVFNLLSAQIGTLQTVYISGFENIKDGPTPTGSVERKKMAARDELGVGPYRQMPPATMPEYTALSAIFTRIKPVINTLAKQAMSQSAHSVNGAEVASPALQQFMNMVNSGNKINFAGGVAGSPETTFVKQFKNAIVSASGSKPGTYEYEDFLNTMARGSIPELKPVLDALRTTLASLAA